MKTEKRFFSASKNVLILLCVMYLITYIDRVNVSTAAAGFKTDFGLTNTQLGLVFSAFAYPYLIIQVFGGWLGDRFGARRTLTVCSLIWATSTIACGFVGGLYSLLAARLALGLGEGATFPLATRAMGAWTERSKRGFVQGIVHSCSRFGNAVTPPIVAWLMALFTWRGSFIALGLISLVWAVCWSLYFRDNPAEHRAITQAELDRLPPYGETRQVAKVPWGPLFRRMLPVSAVYFCYGWTLYLFLSWIPQFFKENYHMDLKNSALFSMGVFLAGVVGDTVGGIVSDAIYTRTKSLRLARRNLMAVALLAAAACLTPVMFTRDLTTIALCLSGGFFLIELSIAPIWAIPMDIAPKFSGSASGIMNAGAALAAIISPVVFGYIVDLTGNWTLPFIGSIGLLVAGAILSFFMKPEKPFEVTGAEIPAA